MIFKLSVELLAEIKIKIGRAKMNTVQVTLSLYYEIVGADLYMWVKYSF